MRNAPTCAGRLVALGLWACACWPAAAVQAQEARCGEAPPEIEFRPFTMARGVALNSPLIMRFARPVDLAVLEDPFEMLEARSGGDGRVELEPVPGRLQRLERTVWAFVPDAWLRPDTLYQGHVVVAAGSGPFADRSERTFNFTTGDAPDLTPPSFSFRSGDVSLRSAPTPEVCGAPEGSYSIVLEFTQASDDGSDGSLEYLLFLTRAEGLEAPRLVARTTQLGAGQGRNSFHFVLEPEHSGAPLCVTAVAVDGVGHRTEGTEPYCFDPIQGSFFEPMCAIGGAGVGSGRFGSWGLGALSVLATLWCRRRFRAYRLRAHDAA